MIIKNGNKTLLLNYIINDMILLQRYHFNKVHKRNNKSTKKVIGVSEKEKNRPQSR